MEPIDIDKVLAAKIPKIYPFIPHMLVERLRKLIHEQEMNHIITQFGNQPPMEFICSCFGYMGISYTADNLDSLDPAGRYLFASNHPFGGMDGMMLAEAIGTRMGDVRVIINDLLMHVSPLKPIWLPVNKYGRQNHAYAATMHEAFAGNIPILTFPAGLCSRRTKGVVEDTPWRQNFVKQALAAKRDIVPVFVEGTLSNRFYRAANIHKRLGIKFNFELVLLVDEMFRQKGKHFTLHFGQPVKWQYLSGLGSPRQQSEYIRSLVYAMK